MRETKQVCGTVLLVPFQLDEERFALHLSAVERVLRAVRILGLPKAPEVVLGVINVHGVIVPVVSPRRRFGLPDRDMELVDRLIIATIPVRASRSQSRPVALLVDSVGSVIEVSDGNVVSATSLVSGLEHIEGVARVADGLILINDLDRFLSISESSMLDTAMEGTDG